MEETYKGHLIRVDALPMPDAILCKPAVQISWREDGKPHMKTWKESDVKPMYVSMSKVEAEMAGRFFARKWIDNGKPNLSKP